MRSAFYVGAACIGLVSGMALGQNVQSIQFQTQPLIYAKGGKTDACGVRLFGVQVRNDLSIVVVDASFNLTIDGLGVVKVTHSEGTLEALKSNSLTTFALTEGWIKTSRKPAPQPLKGKTLTGEDGKSMMYPTAAGAVADLIVSSMEGTVMHVGVRRARENFTRIYSGPVALGDQDLDHVRSCINELIPSI